MARSTPPVRSPLRALISSRARFTASAGRASLHTRWPFSFQQYSFLAGASAFCASTVGASTVQAASSSNWRLDIGAGPLCLSR
jgi:hypothetical protein